MVAILFVCMGNICRSPMAESLFRHHTTSAGLSDHITVDSAGTIGYHVGDPPDSRATRIMRAHGHDITAQRSRKVTNADFEKFTYIIALDEDNHRDLMARSPQAHQNKIMRLLSFDPDTPHTNTPDPYYGGDAGFTSVYDMIDRATLRLLAYVKERHF